MKTARLRSNLSVLLTLSIIGLPSFLYGVGLEIAGESGGGDFSPTAVQGLTSSINSLFSSPAPSLAAMQPILSSLNQANLADPATRAALAPVFTAVQAHAQALQANAAPEPGAPPNPALATKYIAADMLKDYQLPETRAQVTKLSLAYHDALSVEQKEQVRASLVQLHMQSMIRALGQTGTDEAPAGGVAAGGTQGARKLPGSWRLQPATTRPRTDSASSALEVPAVQEREGVPASVTLDPRGFVKGGDRSPAGDLNLITPAQLRRLPHGTVLYSLFDGKRVVVGKDYIDDDDRGGFVAFGFKANSAPAPASPAVQEREGVPPGVRLNPRGLVKGGSAPFASPAGDLNLITPAQLRQLPQGTVLYGRFDGKRVVVGRDYIDDDDRGGFVAFGFKVNSAPAVIQEREGVPASVTLDPRGFVKGGSRSPAGDLNLITPDQLRRLPHGTVLYGLFDGKRVVVGKDYIDDDDRGGFVAFGFKSGASSSAPDGASR